MCDTDDPFHTWEDIAGEFETQRDQLRDDRISLLNAIAWHENATEDPTEADRALWGLGHALGDRA